MGNINVPLQSAYDGLLKQYGLDKVEQSVKCTTESFDAMTNAGWFEDFNVDREQAYEEALAESKNTSRVYTPLLVAIAAEVEEDIRLRGGKLPYDVFVGGFPIGEANACVKPVANGALVLFNHGLMNLIYQIGKVFILSYDWLCALESVKGDVTALVYSNDAPQCETMTATLGWTTCDWSRQKTVNAVIAILHAYIWAENVAYAPRQQLPVHGRAMTLATLVHNAEKFVVAHEYAHVLRGHCEESLTDVPTLAGTLSGVIARTRDQEFEADELAVNLVLASSEWESPGGEFDVNGRIAGIALFFCAVAMLDMARKGPAGFGMEAAGSEDHPTANARMCRLLEFLHRRFGRSGTKLARACIGWMMAIITDVASGISKLSEAIELGKSAQALYEKQRYAEAALLLRRLIHIRENVLGDSDLSIAAPLSDLANCVANASQFGAAEELFSRSVAIVQAAGSLADDLLAISLNNLANHYAAVGQHEKAGTLFRRSMQEAEVLLPRDSTPLKICIHNYLCMLDELKCDEEMEALCKHAVTITRRILGAEHLDVLLNLTNLAAFYEGAKRHDEAVPLMEEVVETSRRVFGEEQPEFAVALGKLGNLYAAISRFEEAEPLCIRALDVIRKTLGEEHPVFASFLHDLGLVYEATKRLNEAERAFRQSAELMLTVLGDHDSNTQQAFASLQRVQMRIAGDA